MARILFITSPQDVAVKQDAVARLTAAGHKVRMLPGTGRMDALECYRVANNGTDAVVVGNLGDLINQQGQNPSVEKLETFLRELQKTGKPIAVYDSLNSTRKREIEAAVPGVTILDLIDVNSRMLPGRLAPMLTPAAGYSHTV